MGRIIDCSAGSKLIKDHSDRHRLKDGEREADRQRE